jgi:hypothetical protein
MPHGVDAGVDPVQAPGVDPAIHACRREPAVGELLTANYATLPFGKLHDPN